jgi:hypothetical protein
VRRFGLFGQDSISWLQNQDIYEGFFGIDPQTEYLVGDDVSQNRDGSSVLLNFRGGMAVNRVLPSLLRIIELNVTAADAIPGNPGTINFNLAYSNFIATSDLQTTGPLNWGPSDPTGNGPGSRLVTSQEYHNDSGSEGHNLCAEAARRVSD